MVKIIHNNLQGEVCEPTVGNSESYIDYFKTKIEEKKSWISINLFLKKEEENIEDFIKEAKENSINLNYPL